jgi:hypothetical protein
MQKPFGDVPITTKGLFNHNCPVFIIHKKPNCTCEDCSRIVNLIKSNSADERKTVLINIKHAVGRPDKEEEDRINFFKQLEFDVKKRYFPVIAIHPDNSLEDVIDCIYEEIYWSNREEGRYTDDHVKKVCNSWKKCSNQIRDRQNFTGYLVVPFSWVHDVVEAQRNDLSLFLHYRWFPKDIYRPSSEN